MSSPWPAQAADSEALLLCSSAQGGHHCWAELGTNICQHLKASPKTTDLTRNTAEAAATGHTNHGELEVPQIAVKDGDVFWRSSVPHSPISHCLPGRHVLTSVLGRLQCLVLHAPKSQDSWVRTSICRQEMQKAPEQLPVAGRLGRTRCLRDWLQH